MDITPQKNCQHDFNGWKALYEYRSCKDIVKKAIDYIKFVGGMNKMYTTYILNTDLNISERRKDNNIIVS